MRTGLPLHRVRPRLAALAGALLAALACGLTAGAVPAAADGDPGSDVLVYQPLFLAADANVSVSQQAQLDALLTRAGQSGFPIRVAIIAHPQDLGSVTALWRKPQAYARFLGTELSLTYSGRLLVVMPNGLGFNWPGHSQADAYRVLSRIPTGPGGAALARATQGAIGSLAAAAGVRLGAVSAGGPVAQQGSRAPSTAPAGAASATAASGSGTAASGSSTAASGSGTDELATVIAVALLACAALAIVARRWTRRRDGKRLGERLTRPRSQIAFAGSLAAVAGAAIVVLVTVGQPVAASSDALASNPNLDPGTPLHRPAPNFHLTDQFGRSVSLDSFRGKVVLLAFNDSECTTICPLTTTAMLDAKAMLGAAGDRVQLLGVDANPKATSLEDVFSYSQLHGMLGAWQFLTGSLRQLQRVWKAYDVQAAIQGGEIAHTPALFMIDPQGRERKLYMTQQSYAAVGQLGQLMAQEASTLLPGHPAVNAKLSYSQIDGISPTASTTLPRAGGGSVHIGPGHPHVYAFFATWDQQVTGLAAGLEGLAGYNQLARAEGLPALEAVDEGSVESAGALSRFLETLPRPLPYPVAVDRDGQLGDGYEVQGLPWLVVVSASGQIVWYDPVNTSGWPSTSSLVAHVREALARAPGQPASATTAQRQLVGSPAPLSELHQQAEQLLGGETALAARIRALRGYPIVINAWASWCAPCRSEFALFASASARYGREVAFLGADTDDSAGDAQSFLAQHPVSYPSYQTTTTNITHVVPSGLAGLPSTIFINRAGKVVWVHTGQYESQGTLDGDIETYALGG